MRLNRLLAGLEYIAAHIDLFGGFDQGKYADEHDSLERATRELASMAADCSNDASKCPQQSFKRPRELPERINWVRVDPKVNAWTQIATVQGGENRVVEARGQWSAWAADTQVPAGTPVWFPGSTGAFLIHQANGSDEQLNATRIYQVPDNSLVYYKIFDSYYLDNRSRPDDPLRAAAHTPVYPLPGLVHTAATTASKAQSEPRSPLPPAKESVK